MNYLLFILIGFGLALCFLVLAALFFHLSQKIKNKKIAKFFKKLEKLFSEVEFPDI